MVTADVELELRQQLKEAGRLLSNQLPSIDELLHILDQLEKLLSMVDQSPNELMQEAYKPPMKALVNGNLLEHSSMDVKVSVASCLCEIKRITAPDAPYSDEVMKRVFQCIVSSLEDLSDESSRSYAKRVSILETVSKVRSCVIMLDLECDDLIVKLFEHFLNSVRDHHLGTVFSLMTNIMELVLEESEDISPEMLKPLLASIKNNSEGVLPVARKLGEAVIRKSADKLRPYLNKAVAILGDLLVDYSPVLTSICEGTTDFVEHNDESASVQPKVVDATSAAIVSLNDAAQVINNGEMNKDGKKQESGKTVQEKDQTKSLSEDDDGMDVSLKSALKKVTKGKGKAKGALSTGSKRKRSVTKKKVTGTVKYDGSLVGEKVKIWWPDDKMYYEGVVDSFDSAKKKHKVLYLDNEEEILNLKNEKWEILKEFSTPIAVEVQNTDVLPEIADGSKGEIKVTSEEVKEVESKEDEETKKNEKEEKPKKIVYSRGRKGSNKKTKSSDGNVRETEAGDAAEEPENEKDPKIGSKSGSRKKKMN
ncbi:hypothetical protein L1987_72222 [Smallanthus sonchifolius]|uniref:Uncharacterized protein n=1 Tax=Smallanthus sonchifolius TaxID=185202 RepID=A0ACB9ATQ5_9ASTR|nr:hypothetical protein L1987_72222 [Smallanthus sonchifolius]